MKIQLIALRIKLALIDANLNSFKHFSARETNKKMQQFRLGIFADMQKMIRSDITISFLTHFRLAYLIKGKLFKNEASWQNICVETK